MFGEVLSFCGGVATSFFGSYMCRWLPERGTSKSIKHHLYDFIFGPPILRGARRSGLVSVGIGQNRRDKEQRSKFDDSRPCGFLDMVENAKQEIWLFHLSGGDQVASHVKNIAEWLLPDKDPNQRRVLRVMALDPSNNELVKAVALLTGRAVNDYKKEIIRVFKELRKEIEDRKKCLGQVTLKKRDYSFEPKVYSVAPACSAVVVDPESENSQLFLEFYGYHISWADRLCIELSSKIGKREDNMCRRYIKAFNELWSGNDAHEYP